jgi:alpha-glucosidase
VDLQQQVSNSTLALTRSCLEVRRGRPALRYGSMRVIEAGEQKLIFERVFEGERLRCTFNLSRQSIAFEASGTPLITIGNIDDGELGPHAALIEEIA